LAAQVAIAIRDPRCFPAGPAPGPIYLPPLSGGKSKTRDASKALSSPLRQVNALWVVISAVATASIVFASVSRDGRQAEFDHHTASVYQVASASPSFSRQPEFVSRHAERANESSSFTDRWGDAEFTQSGDDDGEPVFFTKPVRTVKFARPAKEEVAATGSTGPARATGQPAGFMLASVDSRQVDIDKVPAIRDQTATDNIVVDKDVAEMDEVSQYLWEVYQRAPVKKDGAGDFTWKDPAAAKRMKMSMPKYVIGGMDADFREQLYHAGKAMDAAGVKWAILSAFRDDYRQQIASGIKAAASNSLHGGIARTGGYSHGRAVDITNAEGDMDEVWDWIDDHGAKYGLHRPMPGYDPAHVQSIGDWRKLAGSLRQARLKAAKVASTSR
jgi:hypothetical protein